MGEPKRLLSDSLRDARDRDGINRIVTLTKAGAERWEHAVIPALGIAFERASRSSLPCPYYEGLPESLQTGLSEEWHNLGVYNVARDLECSRGVYTPTALAMRGISDAFSCARFASFTTERTEDGVVTEKILDEQVEALLANSFKKACEETLRKLREAWSGTGQYDKEQAISSYRAGVCAGGLRLILDEWRQRGLELPAPSAL